MYSNKMKMIRNRQDIAVLVQFFYSKVRKDELLGPIFLANITTEQWPGHIEQLTSFWYTNLFREAGYKGNPSFKHIKVDQSTNFGLDQQHFGRWLFLWNETIDSLFGCNLSQRAKYVAKKIAEVQLRIVNENRYTN